MGTPILKRNESGIIYWDHRDIHIAATRGLLVEPESILPILKKYFTEVGRKDGANGFNAGAWHEEQQLLLGIGNKGLETHIVATSFQDDKGLSKIMGSVVGEAKKFTPYPSDEFLAEVIEEIMIRNLYRGLDALDADPKHAKVSKNWGPNKKLRAYGVALYQIFLENYTYKKRAEIDKECRNRIVRIFR